MSTRRAPILCLLFLLGEFSNGYSCTVFLASDGDTVLAGNNEDWHIPLTKVWFIPPQNEKYGVVYFTFNNHRSIQGGMNDQGLIFDFLAVKPRDVETTPGKEPWGGHPIRMIMEQCATVDEAVRMFESHSRAFMRRFYVFLGDAHGNSALVEAEAVVKKKGSFQVATNFRQSLMSPAKSSCRRHQIARARLAKAEQLDVDLFRDICASVHQEGGNSTLYSTIYDLKRKVVYLYHFHNYQQVYVIDLEEELAKGERILEMPDLFPPNFAFEQFRRAAERRAQAQDRVPAGKDRD